MPNTDGWRVERQCIERKKAKKFNFFKRHETFLLVCGGGTASSVDNWVRFTRADMMEEVEERLEEGDTTTALLYWIR